jgi:hypothetical protein
MLPKVYNLSAQRAQKHLKKRKLNVYWQGLS